jgi:DNA-binding MarR family transcriptional regulator
MSGAADLHASAHEVRDNDPVHEASDEAHGDERGQIRSRDYLQAFRSRHEAAGSASQEALAAMEVVALIARLAARLNQDFDQVHADTGISWAGFRLLAALWVVGDSEPTQLARLTGGSKASVSSVINTLERDGFVERHHDARDRRSVRVSMTPLGQARMRDAMRRQGERERAWTAVLSERDIASLRRILGKLVSQPTP